MENRIINNQVTISGEIVSEFSFSHEVYGEKFYTAELSVERKSGQHDILPIMVSDRLVDISKEWTGQIVKVSGQLRTYNKREENKNRLLLSVFVRELEVLKDDGHKQMIKTEFFLTVLPVNRRITVRRRSEERSQIFFLQSTDRMASQIIFPVLFGEEMRDLQATLKLAHIFRFGADYRAGNIRRKSAKMNLRQGLLIRYRQAELRL